MPLNIRLSSKSSTTKVFPLIEGHSLTVFHNRVSGAKLVTLGDKTLVNVEREIIEWSTFKKSFSIGGTIYELTITPLWWGGFSYKCDTVVQALDQALLCSC